MPTGHHETPLRGRPNSEVPESALPTGHHETPLRGRPDSEVLDRPVYRPLWAAARRRIEANGLSLEGSPITLKNLTSQECDAIVGLLGVRRPAQGSRAQGSTAQGSTAQGSTAQGSTLRISLLILDRSLRSSSVGVGLVEVLSTLGGPLVDRRAAKQSSATERAQKWAELGTHPSVVRNSRLNGWLDYVRSTGFDRRLTHTDDAGMVGSALDVLGIVDGDTRYRLAVLAADVVGDAHGLDRGRPVGTLAVHALSWLRNEQFPTDAADWRRVWADAGVACDDLSCDVLVLNLPGFSKEPLRLTLRQVISWSPPPMSTSAIYVCENPAVVAAAADRLGESSPPLVCVDGMPSTAALMVLDRLSQDGHAIGYHGDFDWRGLGIATVVARKLPTTIPWRYGASDYQRAVVGGLGTVELFGRAASSPWDDALASAMEAAGVAIYEEQVIGELVDDLGS